MVDAPPFEAATRNTFRRWRVTLLLAGTVALAATSACGSSSTTMLQPSNDRCSIAMSGSPSPISSSGGTGSLNITAARECVWSASSDAAWLTITSGSPGQGDGTITYAVAGNSAPATRRGNVTVNNQRTEIVQSAAPCQFRLNPAGQSFERDGGEGTVGIETVDGCAWTASSNVPWIVITATQQTNGPGTLRFRVEPNAGEVRASTITIAGQPFAVAQAGSSTPPQCRFDIDPSSSTAPAEGGASTFTVASMSGCQWTATSQAPWITVTSGASGSGNGTVALRYAANSGPFRVGTVTVANHLFTVTQSAALVCSYTLAPPAFAAGSGASTTSFAVTTPNGCAWTAVSQAPTWITITSGATGNGNGTVGIAIAANPDGARSGTVVAGGQTFTVNQAAISCTFTIAPTSSSAPAAGGGASVTVTAPSSCAWTAVSQAPWITIASGASGNGNGTVNVTIAANGGAARTGTVTIAGQTYTVDQAAAPAPCTYSIAPIDQAIAAAGGTTSVAVTTQTGCAWTAVSQQPWIAVTNGASGSGNGAVELTIARNMGAARSGTVIIAGQTFTVNQAAEPTPCVYSIAPQSQSMPPSGGTTTVAVTASNGNCAWTAVSQVPWIVVDRGASERGNGSVDLTIAQNTGAARSGTVAIAGQTFTINQAAAPPPPCTYAFDPTAQMVPSAGGDFTVAVNTQAGCAWTVTSSVPWITFIDFPTGPASGTGPGSVRYRVSVNSAAAQRVGTLDMSGQVLTVTQVWP